jgi:hypothetical protein
MRSRTRRLDAGKSSSAPSSGTVLRSGADAAAAFGSDFGVPAAIAPAAYQIGASEALQSAMELHRSNVDRRMTETFDAELI